MKSRHGTVSVAQGAGKPSKTYHTHLSIQLYLLTQPLLCSVSNYHYSFGHYVIGLPSGSVPPTRLKGYFLLSSCRQVYQQVLEQTKTKIGRSLHLVLSLSLLVYHLSLSLFHTHANTLQRFFCENCVVVTFQHSQLS